MDEFLESRLGQLALARGLVRLQPLLDCMNEAGQRSERLSTVLVERELLESSVVEELHDFLSSRPHDVVDRELERGATLLLDTLSGEDSSGAELSLVETLDDAPLPHSTLGAPDDSPASDVHNPPGERQPRYEVSDSPLETRYEFERDLGVGGMGRVVLARDRFLERKIAIKMLRDERLSDDSSRHMLHQEAMITGNLEHPSIVPVYDYGGDRERGPYYSMRVIRERNLSQILREMRENPDAEQFTTNQLLNILRQVLLAVHFAHERGVVHRDLKPENILIGEYGEVYVIDWGVAKVDPARLGIGGVETIEGVAVGSLVGTPQYMAPEQARGHNESIDARSDIYAMGTVLYEMLTLEPVFKVDSVLALLYHVAHETPTSPSMRAPSRHISSKLDEICLRALAKNPDNRFQSAQDFADAIKLYLEGVKERERRLQRAEQARDRADEAREVYRRRRKTYIQKSRELAALRLRVPSHAPAAEKRPLWDLEQEVEDTSIELEQLFGETIRRYGSALSHRPDDPETRRTLSDLYWERFRQAELSDNRAEAAYFESLVRQYDDGRYQSLLEGEARLGLRSEPPSAGVSLYRYESTQYRLVENRVRDLGVSPISATSVPHGSYLLVVERDGYVPLRIPVRLDRMQTRSLDIRLWREDELPAGFVVISAGDFLQGTLQPADLEAARTEVPVFAIMRYPVTCAQYIDFLNALARESPERAARHAPRTSEDAESYFPVDSDGLYYLPREDREGDAWDPHWPICLVNYHDAHAFAEWMTRRDGRNYRLPTALEWEKAARGVDGRLYPWGNHFDASFCNMRESSRGKPMPVPVGSFPVDRSPYGLMDVAGNICEWTSTWEDQSQTARILQGASYNSVAPMCRLDSQMASPPSYRYAHYGFRLALELD